MCSPFNSFDEESYLSPLIISNLICTYQQHWHWQVPAASLRFQLFPEQLAYVDVNSWFPIMLKSPTGYPNRSCCIFPILSKSWTKAVQTKIGWWPSVQALRWVRIHLTLNLMMMPMLMISVPLLRRTKLWSEAVEDSGEARSRSGKMLGLTCICVGSLVRVFWKLHCRHSVPALPAKNGKLAKSSPTKSTWIPLPRSIFLTLCIGTVHSFL